MSAVPLSAQEDSSPAPIRVTPTREGTPLTRGSSQWARKDLNLRRQCRLVYSQFPLATRARTLGGTTIAASHGPPAIVRVASVRGMPSFDVVSEIDQQEIRNAVDQASREVTTRYDFKGTDTTIELSTTEIKLHSSSEDRLAALRQLLEEKLVKRKVSLKALDYQKVEEASGATARQLVKLVAGISKEKATELNKHIKGAQPEGHPVPGAG